MYKLDIRRQGLTILTTEACNFACLYCHQIHHPSHMCLEVMNSIVAFVRRKAKNIDKLDVSWFGGEPLANTKAVLFLAEEFTQICNSHDISLSGFMSTNGFLLDKALFTKLLKVGISRFQITFDGPQETHDEFRVSATGAGTFDRIWNNLLSYRDISDFFEVLIRVHVTPNTLEEVKDFLPKLNDEFASDPRFKIAVTNVSHWGGPNDASIAVYEDPESILASLNSLVAPSHLPAIRDNVYCNAADPTHLVIRPDGSVVKCAHSLDLEENHIGFLEPDGRLTYEPGKIDFWIRGLLSTDNEALRCPRKELGVAISPRELIQISLA